MINSSLIQRTNYIHSIRNYQNQKMSPLHYQQELY